MTKLVRAVVLEIYNKHKLIFLLINYNILSFPFLVSSFLLYSDGFPG